MNDVQYAVKHSIYVHVSFFREALVVKEYAHIDRSADSRWNDYKIDRVDI